MRRSDPDKFDGIPRETHNTTHCTIGSTDSTVGQKLGQKFIDPSPPGGGRNVTKVWLNRYTVVVMCYRLQRYGYWVVQLTSPARLPRRQF